MSPGQNEGNLLSLTRKKKKKKKQQQPAFWARYTQRPISAPSQQWRTIPQMGLQGSNRTLLQLPSPQAFQAPHHQQESMLDLTDDTSPNTPLAAGSWKPVGNVTTKTQHANMGEIKILPSRREKWLRFQESLKSQGLKSEDKLDNADKIEDNKNNVQSNTEQNETKKHEELNKSEEKEDACEGTTQSIKSENKVFVQNKDQPMVSTQKTSTVTEDFADKKVVSQPTTSSNQYTKPFNSQRQPTSACLDTLYGYYPKGIPKSFLMQQNSVGVMGAIQPQDPNNPRTSHYKPIPTLYETQGLNIKTDVKIEKPQQYSPSDIYEDGSRIDEERGSESPNGQTGEKRLSAFQRLGPLSQPKKPKLTINLLCSEDQSVREVLNTQEDDEKYTPVHLRKDIINSKDETVIKYLPFWPWKRNVAQRKSVTLRSSKSVMILEQEQMEEVYDKDNAYIQVTVKGYHSGFKKEDILNAILDTVRGKSFIPCFIEFSQQECKFLVIRSRAALIMIHKMGFLIRKDDAELGVTISQTDLNLNQIDFIPRLILRKILLNGYDGERKLCLKEFTIKNDLSHFIYFPLSRTTNQAELVQLQSAVAWNFLTDLDLSHNRLTTIDGFDLPRTTPKLKHLDLSYNCIERVAVLLRSRGVSLRSLKLEGNPLCTDYTDPRHYVRVIKMIFPGLTEIDGVKIQLKGEFPEMKRNYCPDDALDIANKFVQVFFPLLDCSYDERASIEELYHKKATMTISFRYSLRYSALHRKFRNIFLLASMFDEGHVETIDGAASIVKLISKWPDMRHDPHTFSVDVIHHNNTSTILRVGGIVKLTSENLADDEHLVAFTRTLVLTTHDGMKYKILNEMIYWDEPTREFANSAFQMNAIRIKQLKLKRESTPDEDVKEKLIEMFMKVTELKEEESKRCLELKKWDIKSAIEYFMKHVKLDELDLFKNKLAKIS